MGKEVLARCGCGVETPVAIGGGMLNFTTTCYFPCLCDACHGVVQANLLAKPVRCPNCQADNPIPYDDPRLCDAPGKRQVAQWCMQHQLGRDLMLTDGNYRCPKCGNMTLRFIFRGCWD